MRYDIVFDGPPGSMSGRFVEVENESGASVRFGEWVERDDGYWVLRFDVEDVLVVEEDGDYHTEKYRWDKNILMVDVGRYALMRIDEEGDG